MYQSVYIYGLGMMGGSLSKAIKIKNLTEQDPNIKNYLEGKDFISIKSRFESYNFRGSDSS